MTAIVSACSFAYVVISLTFSASSTKRSFSTREQDGHEMMLRVSSSKTGTERKRPPAMSARIWSPTVTSSCLRGLGRVRLTRIVSPIPRETSCSKATRVLMTPSGGIPASVTPRWRGTSGRAAAKRRFASMTLRGWESLRLTT